jgi:hypothetical protein
MGQKEREKIVKKRNSSYTSKHEKLINRPIIERSKKNVNATYEKRNGTMQAQRS